MYEQERVSNLAMRRFQETETKEPQKHEKSTDILTAINNLLNETKFENPAKSKKNFFIKRSINFLF